MQSNRMCERDSSQAQLMVKDQETSVTMKGMEMMVEAMSSKQLGGTEHRPVHGPPRRGEAPQQEAVWPPGSRRRLSRRIS